MSYGEGLDLVVPDDYKSPIEATDAISDTPPLRAHHSIHVRKGTYIENPEPWDRNNWRWIRLKNNVDFYGDGVGNTVIKMWEKWKRLKDTGPQDHGNIEVNASYVTVRDMTIDGNHMNDPTAGGGLNLLWDHNIMQNLELLRGSGGISACGDYVTIQNYYAHN